MLLALGLLLSCGLASTSCRSEEETSFNALMDILDECKMDLESAVTQLDINRVNVKLEKAITQALALKLDSQEGALQKKALLKRCKDLRAVGEMKARVIGLSIAMGAVPTQETMLELTRQCVALDDPATIRQVVEDFWKQQGHLIEDIEMPNTLQSQELRSILELRGRIVAQLKANARLDNANRITEELYKTLELQLELERVKQSNSLLSHVMPADVQELKKMSRKVEKVKKNFIAAEDADKTKREKYYKKASLELKKMLEDITSILPTQLEVLDDVLIKHGGRYVN